MKNFSIILWIFILTGIDQFIKLIIHTYYLHTCFPIIPSLLEFQPTFNHKYLYINNLFDLGDGLRIHLILFPVVTFTFFFLWSYLRSISRNSKWIDRGFTCVCAGLLSGLVCTLFWEGTLDYLYLKPLFVFDLKDLYLHGFAFFLIIHSLLNRNDLQHIKIREFMCHTKKLLRHLRV